VVSATQQGRFVGKAAVVTGGSRSIGAAVAISYRGNEHFGALETITPADFDRVFTVNTRGQLFTVQHAVPHLSFRTWDLSPGISLFLGV